MFESIYLIFFGIVGLTSIKIKQPRSSNTPKLIKYSQSRIGYFYLIFLIILTFGLSVLFFMHLTSENIAAENPLTLKLRISMRVARTLTIFVIWLNCFFKQSQIVDTANSYLRMNTEAVKIYDDISKSKFKTKHVIFYILIVAHLILLVSSIATSYLCNGIFDIRILTNVFDFVISVHIFQYATILAVIKTKFESMRLKLAELAEIYNALQAYVIVEKDKYLKILLQVKTIQRNHAELADICDSISEIFGISVLFSLAYVFGTTVHYSYFVISQNFVHPNRKSMVYTIDTVIPLARFIVSITAFCVLANDVGTQQKNSTLHGENFIVEFII
ncbi:GSCOCT00013880001.3-RA-CDS [Cotesia congregata]|uniref:Gustatory receptor n=1 Tax=Cotesia congregata TaxID=51543 RepID=A0A8J2E7C9_COTCN|nr:GSCOCT00013880001.3-RA-CDS [Cotesia congregata]CAG5075854.1 gustatory receptor 63 [Cotesia congregata]